MKSARLSGMAPSREGMTSSGSPINSKELTLSPTNTPVNPASLQPNARAAKTPSPLTAPSPPLVGAPDQEERRHKRPVMTQLQLGPAKLSAACASWSPIGKDRKAS